MPIPVRVVSVERSLFEGDADFVKCRSLEGELGILPHHSPLLAVLAPGEVRIDKTGGGGEHNLEEDPNADCDPASSSTDAPRNAHARGSAPPSPSNARREYR